MDNEFFEHVFLTAYGMAAPHCRINGVENLFEAEKPCHQYYNKAIDAYNRVCIRMGLPVQDVHGVPYEDSDMLELLHNMDLICQDMAEEMFRCGIAYRDGKIKPNPPGISNLVVIPPWDEDLKL